MSESKPIWIVVTAIIVIALVAVLLVVAKNYGYDPLKNLISVETLNQILGIFGGSI